MIDCVACCCISLSKGTTDTFTCRVVAIKNSEHIINSFPMPATSITFLSHYQSFLKEKHTTGFRMQLLRQINETTTLGGNVHSGSADIKIKK